MLQCREAKGYLGVYGGIGKFGLFLSEGPSSPALLGAIPSTTFLYTCGRAFGLADQTGPFLKFAGMVGFGPRPADRKRERAPATAPQWSVAKWRKTRLGRRAGWPCEKRNGRGGGTRTHDPRFWRPMLYQLSYTPAGKRPSNAALRRWQATSAWARDRTRGDARLRTRYPAGQNAAAGLSQRHFPDVRFAR